MAGAKIVPVVDEVLGNSAYLVDLGDGRALAVDAPRDLQTFRAHHAPRLGGQPAVTMCGLSERAATAASVLERAGRTSVAIASGGRADWAEATGAAPEVST